MEVGSYRILPESNKLLGDPLQVCMRSAGLGPHLRQLRDNLLLDLLCLLDAVSLGKLACVSHACHLLSGLDVIWRDIVLSHTGGQRIAFTTSWKETYLRLTQASVGLKQLASCNYYSDDLFHQLLCTRFDLSLCPGILGPDSIPRISAAHLTVEAFVRLFEEANRPVIITDAITHWPAMAWTPASLIQQMGQHAFRASSATAPMPVTFTMEDYFTYASLTHDEVPFYLFDKGFASAPRHRQQAQPMSNSASPEADSSSTSQRAATGQSENPADSTHTHGHGQGHGHCDGRGHTPGQDHGSLEEDYSIPKYFDPSIRTGDADLFHVLGAARPDHRWLVIGPARSGSIYHIDPNATHAWNAVLSGRKKWIFYPPHTQPPGVQRTEDSAEAIVPVSTAEWLLTFWAFHLENREHSSSSSSGSSSSKLPPWHSVYNDLLTSAPGIELPGQYHAPRSMSSAPLECIQGPGEIIFVPHGYWHMVYNLEDSIALTHNYVSRSNLSDVLRFLRDTPDQITGMGGSTLQKPAVVAEAQEADYGAAPTADLYQTFLDNLPSVLDEQSIGEALEKSFQCKPGQPQAQMQAKKRTAGQRDGKCKKVKGDDCDEGPRAILPGDTGGSSFSFGFQFE